MAYVRRILWILADSIFCHFSQRVGLLCNRFHTLKLTNCIFFAKFANLIAHYLYNQIVMNDTIRIGAGILFVYFSNLAGANAGFH